MSVNTHCDECNNDLVKISAMVDENEVPLYYKYQCSECDKDLDITEDPPFDNTKPLPPIKNKGTQ